MCVCVCVSMYICVYNVYINIDMSGKKQGQTKK